MNDRIKEILSWYDNENPGVIKNIYSILMHGKLAGTGKVVILPVDQGFEHGPARSFAPNPPGYDPVYHVKLAIDAGLNAHAAPLGSIQAMAREYAGQIPLILKVNSHDLLNDSPDPVPSVTASVEDALKLGCAAVGFTIYPGSINFKKMYEEVKDMALEAKRNGLAVVIWSYPRGSGLSKKGETAVDVVAYAVQIAAQLGAHLIKVKPPSEHIELEEARKIYEKYKIPIGTLSERVKHVTQSAFDGKRIVIFSGGPAKGREEVIEEIRQIKKGGAFGSIIGRNTFQRPREEALDFLDEVLKIYLED
ncbi:MAG: fructose-bisphosphate aldolase [delta proteobacterium ML8_D]|jgi:fructose-bisphosphate aldolase, class I|nr:MAG: fructose-bisphosphate aldolase [delta proteobacterium ML8_D]